MLVWIASYPGSLDVVLLEYLHRRYGIPWYEADLLDQSDLSSDALLPGQKSARGLWRRIYERALETDRLVIARTSFPPSDDLPFIYLSRNGSDQLRYLYYHYLTTNSDFTPASLILGHHQVGDWTSHYDLWKNHPKRENGVFLKTEDFLTGDPTFFNAVEHILGNPEVKTMELGEEDPRRSVPDPAQFPAWSPDELWLFRLLHGESARERGYPVPALEDSAASPHVPTDALLKFLHQHRTSVKLVGQMHGMAGYIDSLKEQLAEETERLRDYIAILKEENERLKSDAKG
jgi:hypothetical protein